MANSKYEYVKTYEAYDFLLPSTWIVVRIDGRSFHRFAEVHGFEKPNDVRALQLMNECTKSVMEDLKEIVVAFGQSDEYSFVLHKDCNLYQRRSSKLVSVIVSLFASTYVMKWGLFLPTTVLKYAPSFDGRAVCYPSDSILRDYLAWRQVDCHINNQYNTCLWKLVQSGKSLEEACDELKGTNADFKNELLFKQFALNYNTLPEIFRKGSVIYRKKVQEILQLPSDNTISRERKIVIVEHCDIIGDSFWLENPFILQKTKQKKDTKRSVTWEKSDKLLQNQMQGVIKP